MARESAEIRGRARVRPFRVGQLVDTNDGSATLAAIANLSSTWGGYYTPILDANQTSDDIEHQARVFDVDAIYLELSEGDLYEDLRGRGWLWRGLARYGPFGPGEDGFQTGLLPASAVALDPPELLLPTWDAGDPFALFYAALFGTTNDGTVWEPPGSRPVGLEGVTAHAGLPLERVGIIQATRVGLAYEPHVDLDWMNGVFVVRPDNPQDLVDFWNMRSFGRPVIAVPSEGPEDLLAFLTRGKVPGGTSVYGSGRTRRTEEYLGVWRLENASQGTRDAIDAMAAQLGMVVRDHHFEAKNRYRFTGVDTRFKSTVRAEFSPTARHVMVRVPILPLVPEAHQVMPGIVAVEIDVHSVPGLDPRTAAALPPLRRFGRLLERSAFGHSKTIRVNAEGDGLVLGVSARDDEVPVPFAHHLDAIAELFDKDDIKLSQSEDGRFQTRAAQMLGGAHGSLMTQPGVRSLIDKAGRSSTGLPLQQLKSEVRNNAGSWPDAITSLRTSVAEYAEHTVNSLLFSGLFVPMLDAHCSNCRVDMQVSPRDLDSTVHCEFCGETFRLALSLSLSKSRWRFRLASHLGPDKVKALLPALATSSLLGQLSARFEAPGPLAFGVEFKLQGNMRMEADLVTYLMRPDWAVAVAEVKNGNWIDDNDVRNLEELQGLLDNSGVRSVLVFSSLKDTLAPAEIHALRGLVERAAWTTTAFGTEMPRVPLVLTKGQLSLPWDNDDHPGRWGTPGIGTGIFSTALESCRRNLGLVDLQPLSGGNERSFTATWNDAEPETE